MAGHLVHPPLTQFYRCLSGVALTVGKTLLAPSLVSADVTEGVEFRFDDCMTEEAEMAEQVCEYGRDALYWKPFRDENAEYAGEFALFAAHACGDGR